MLLVRLLLLLLLLLHVYLPLLLHVLHRLESQPEVPEEETLVVFGRRDVV